MLKDKQLKGSEKLKKMPPSEDEGIFKKIMLS
jgi:hypothetical protein